MRCEDRGEDLLARALGQTGASASADLEVHLRDCATCRAEAARIDADLRRAAAMPAIAPPADGLARLLASVADDAAERRAAAAVATARSCEGVREDAVALAVGALPAEERPRVEAHLAACAACAEEREVAGRLAAAQRSSPAVPVPAGGLARLLAAVRAGEPASAPSAPALALPARRRAATRWARVLVPLAAAAAVLAALLASGDGRIAARIDGAGSAILRDASGKALVPTYAVDRLKGAFVLLPHHELLAGTTPVEVALGLGREPGPGGDPGPDEARLTLLPGTLLEALDGTSLELRSGRVRVRAGRLGGGLTIRAGPSWARVVGTRFEAALAEDRLVVSVEEGEVELGRDAPGRASVRLGPGRRGLVGPGRLLEAAADGRDPVEALLAPVARLTGPTASLAAGAALDLEAEVACGPGGPVTLAPFDASEPRFLVRLKDPDGRVREVKVLPSMLRTASEGPLAVRIDESGPYRLRIRIPLDDAAPGGWEARLRYHSYRPRASGAEWLGTVESGDVRFEVRRE